MTRVVAASCLLTIVHLMLIQPVLAQAKAVPWVAKSVQPNGFDVQLPGNVNPLPRSGLELEIDSRWINNYGYRPIQVTVSSAKPTTVNHLITIRLYEGFAETVSVEQDIEMPMGSTLIDATIACPQFRGQMNYWWDVWVDGVKEPALSTEAGSGLQVYPAYPNQGTNGSLKFLVLGLPARANQTTSPGASMFETLVLTVPDLPSRWIDYTCFDVIALAPGEMQLIAQTRPDALVAICRWVRCGGQLWISPVGDQWEALLDVERLLKGSAGAVGKATIGDDADVAAGDEVPNHTATSAVPLTDDDVVARGWRPIKIASTAQTNSDAATAADDQTVAKNTRADSLAWYVEQPLGLGFVRVYRKAWEPSGLAWSLQMLNAATPPDESPPMPTPLSAALATTRNWESRHGMAPDAANTDFANLLVPGVGLAPVTEFRILITLFALAIGPVNYWLLKRWNRPHLLVLTVPIMAVLVTLALFAHAILSDGFGTTVRVRSFTSLDQ
ncbi:MAG TPA: hypothetical protein VGM76_02795, partial [Lacipirellulaceae bacterium]